MRIGFATFILCFCSILFGQSYDRLDVPFEGFENALTGGFEAPQIQAINLNNDGLDDLLVFDRKGSVIRTFVYDESKSFPYVYAPEYESIFPEIPCWVIVNDFNNDGEDDLFTCGVTDQVTGIEVWIASREEDKLSFSPFAHPNSAYNIIYYERNNEFKQLYVGNNGIPGVGDIDDDGDTDILAFQPSGGYLYYFKNMSVERGYGADSLLYVREDDCWGNFYEGGLEPDILLNETNDGCALPSGSGAVSSRHEGITISIFDKNKDGIKDLLLGEVSSNHLFYVQNGGTKDDAFATFKEKNFPQNDVPVQMQIFLSTFLLDVDKDGEDDLLVAPNSQFGTNTNQVSYYQRVDTNFQLIQEDWLVGTTLDFGTDAYPSFIDYNSDGLMDIVVGSFGLLGLETGTETRLFLLENKGTTTDPLYELIDDNYLDFLAYSEFDFSFTPSFGDIDGDGDQDMICGTLSGDLVFLENSAGAGNPVVFENPIFNYFSLDVENNTVKVDIADLNSDGLGDIIVGGRNSYAVDDSIASLKVFWNTGTVGNASFSNVNIQYGIGGVNVKQSGVSKVSTSPKYFMGEDRSLLFVGDESGRVLLYEFTTSDKLYTLIDERLIPEYLGRRTRVDVADIDADGYLEMIIGNERGGLNLYNTEVQVNGMISDVSELLGEDILQLFPNPAKDVIYFEESSGKVLIYNVLGELVLRQNINNNSLNVSSLHSGTYFLRTQNGRQTKFVKL